MRIGQTVILGLAAEPISEAWLPKWLVYAVVQAFDEVQTVERRHISELRDSYKSSYHCSRRLTSHRGKYMMMNFHSERHLRVAQEDAMSHRRLCLHRSALSNQSLLHLEDKHNSSHSGFRSCHKLHKLGGSELARPR